MTVYYDSPLFALHHGDALEVLRELPDESVHCCITSPPYFSLRSYLPDGHPDKKYELGSEPSLDAYLSCIVGVFGEVKRVLRPDATCWINVGDSYVSGQGGRQSSAGELPSVIRRDRPDPKPRPDLENAPSSWAERAMTVRTYPASSSGLKPKDLLLVPFRLALALQADGWYVRQVIVWAKGVSFCDSYSGSVMPESAKDRPTTSHEYLLLLSKNARYFYDGEACREPAIHAGAFVQTRGNEGMDEGYDGHRTRDGIRRGVTVASSRNLRSVWVVNPQPYPGPHYATYPEKLVEPCVLLGTSAKGCCPECGAPWEREVEKEPHVQQGCGRDHIAGGDGHGWEGTPRASLSVSTLGWRPGCECLIDAPDELLGEGVSLVRPDPIPATVLDPFLGSGTSALVANRLGRRCIGIELNGDDCERAVRRITGSETREIATDAGAHADGTPSLLGALTELRGVCHERCTARPEDP